MKVFTGCLLMAALFGCSKGSSRSLVVVHVAKDVAVPVLNGIRVASSGDSYTYRGDAPHDVGLHLSSSVSGTVHLVVDGLIDGTPVAHAETDAVVSSGHSTTVSITLQVSPVVDAGGEAGSGDTAASPDGAHADAILGSDVGASGGTDGSLGSGGSTGTGGSTGAGGFAGTGGSSGSGGFTGTAGSIGSGGLTGTDGPVDSPGTGGSIGSGGSTGTGGIFAVGGVGSGGIGAVGGTSAAGGGATGGASAAGGVATGGVADASMGGNVVADTGTSDGMDGPASDGPDTTATNVGFSCTLSCGGGVTVFLGVRPPSTSGSDAICWTSASGGPTGDQLWTYDAVNRVLVNQLTSLALKTRADSSVELGASATDGSPLTVQLNVDGTYSLVFDNGNVLGLNAANCPGGYYVAVPPGAAGYVTSFQAVSAG